MPDLNELLRWSIANSTAPSASAPAAASSSGEDQQMSLRFNPTSTHSGTSALHPSDRLLNEVSPASTPGPATPRDGSSLPLPPGAEVPGAAKREDLTTEMLDLIMGKSDSIVMKEKMEIALDESKSVEDRVEALDDFEMLIELIDNANNMPILKLWEPLLSLLASPHPEIVAHTCWIMGTAVQNNLKAQAALYIFDALPRILSIIYPPSNPHPSSVRAKATYALSSALKHWPLAASVLSTPSSSSDSSSSSQTGYSVLKRGVVDSDPIVRRKMAFLIGTLAMQSGEVYEGEIPNEVRNLLEERMKAAQGEGPSETLVQGLQREGVFAELVKGLKESGEDVEYEENTLRALARAAEKGGLTNGEKTELRGLWEKLGAAGQEERGLSGSDGKDIEKAFSS
ncbi:hypothetical protein IAT38_005219 [Cryptococcus sp. DSM 104549]